MGEFFKGWRRKTGVVTLLMACVFAAGWVRSEMVCDDVNVIFNGRKYWLYSYNSSLILEQDSWYPLNSHLE